MNNQIVTDATSFNCGNSAPSSQLIKSVNSRAKQNNADIELHAFQEMTRFNPNAWGFTDNQLYSNTKREDLIDGTEWTCRTKFYKPSRNCGQRIYGDNAKLIDSGFVGDEYNKWGNKGFSYAVIEKNGIRVLYSSVHVDSKYSEQSSINLYNRMMSLAMKHECDGFIFFGDANNRDRYVDGQWRSPHKNGQYLDQVTKKMGGSNIKTILPDKNTYVGGDKDPSSPSDKENVHKIDIKRTKNLA